MCAEAAKKFADIIHDSKEATMLPEEIRDQQREQREVVGRPLPDAMEQVELAVAKVNALVDGWRAAGEITIKVDVLQWPSVFTLHVPLPKDA